MTRKESAVNAFIGGTACRSPPTTTSSLCVSSVRHNITASGLSVNHARYRSDITQAGGWAAALHGVEDFYSHANWVEMAIAGVVPKNGLGGTELVDSGLGYWTVMNGGPFFVRSNVVHFNTDTPDLWTTNNDGAGDLNFVFSLFTDDVRRSTQVQMPTIASWPRSKAGRTMTNRAS